MNAFMMVLYTARRLTTQPNNPCSNKTSDQGGKTSAASRFSWIGPTRPSTARRARLFPGATLFFLEEYFGEAVGMEVRGPLQLQP